MSLDPKDVRRVSKKIAQFLKDKAGSGDLDAAEARETMRNMVFDLNKPGTHPEDAAALREILTAVYFAFKAGEAAGQAS